MPETHRLLGSSEIRKKWGLTLFLTGALLLPPALFFSFPFFMNAAAGLLFSGALWYPSEKGVPMPWWAIGLFAALWFFPFLSGIISAFSSEWAVIIIRKLPLLILPWAMYRMIPVVPVKFIRAFLTLFVSVALSLSGMAFLHYKIHQAELDALLLQSKEIPTLTGISHIYFSMWLVMAVLAWLWLWITLRKTNTFLARICLVGAFFQAILVHLLSSRTAWLSLDAALLSLGVYWSWRNHSWKPALISFLALMIGIPAAYYGSSGIRNRVDNSLEDIRRYRNDEYIGYYSLAMRLKGYEMGFEAAGEKPFTGWGVGRLPQTLTEMYNRHRVREDSRLENLHNQYLDALVLTGIPGCAALICWAIYFMRSAWRNRRLLGVLAVAAWLAAMLTETFLERQSGIMAVSFFIPLFSLLPGQDD